MLRTLDVIIGLAFVFSILSIVCSAIAEGIEALVRRRSRDLETGVRRLLADGGEDLPARFYGHPLVKALFDRDGKRPSYISSRSFALALVDSLAASDAAKRDGATLLDRLPDNPLGQAVRTLALSAGGDLEGALKAVERWFDDAMDRVSSVYKRWTRGILLTLGIVLAAALNADTVNLASMLATDGALRQAVVEAALRPRSAPPVAPTALAPSAPRSGTGSGAGASLEGTPPSGLELRSASEQTGAGGRAAPSGGSPAEVAARGIEQLQALSLPMGWSGERMAQDPRGLPDTASGWVTKILGILVTGFALSLGAPFWFDVLNKVARLRTATKPERSTRA